MFGCKFGCKIWVQDWVQDLGARLGASLGARVWPYLFQRYFSKGILYMSIVALKRNSRRFQVPVSADGFSLNGGHRNQRVIGNTNLSALSNGSNNICSVNDPTIVKPSTKNTKGYLYSTVLYPTCPATGCPDGLNRRVNWVKNFVPEDHSAGQYIKDIVISNAALCVTTKPDSGTNTICNDPCKVRAYHIGGRYVYTTFNAKNSGKPYQQGAITAGEYLKAGLLKYKKYNCGVTPASIAPIPPALLNSGCIHC
jgi:hypothetical protein